MLPGDEIFLTILFCQIPSVSSEKLNFFYLACCEVFRLRCHGHNYLLFSYLCKIKRKNSSCSACVINCRIQLTFFWIVSHTSLSGAPSLALLLPSLISGPGIRAWFDCWVSTKFLCAFISRKRSDNTTTISKSVQS